MFKFTNISDDITIEYTMNVEETGWFELIGGFQCFLKASGYHFHELMDMRSILEDAHQEIVDEAYHNSNSVRQEGSDYSEGDELLFEDSSDAGYLRR